VVVRAGMASGEAIRNALSISFVKRLANAKNEHEWFVWLSQFSGVKRPSLFAVTNQPHIKKERIIIEGPD